MTEPTEQDMAAARLVMEKYRHAAGEAVKLIKKACEEDNPQAGAYLAQQVHTVNDVNFLMMVLGQLATQLVMAERRANDANGPMITPAEMGFDPKPQMPWQVAVTDQLGGAAEQGDNEAFARIAVDAELQGLEYDESQGQVIDFDYLLRSQLLLDRSSLMVTAAEMLRRLRETKDG